MNTWICARLKYARGLGVAVVAFVSFVIPAWSASVSQHTEGSCSPAVAEVKGSVTIICEGVDPSLLNEMVKLLNEILKDRKQLEQIDRKLADRQLMAAQIKVIADSIQPFGGQEFKITSYWDMKEPMALTKNIFATLTLGGWIFIKHETGTVLLGGIEGIQVYVHPNADERAKKAANLLVSALNKEGITSILKLINDPKHPTNQLHLNVGTKP